MVVALEPKLILLDEPTAGLTKVERTTIGATLPPSWSSTISISSATSARGRE